MTRFFVFLLALVSLAASASAEPTMCVSGPMQLEDVPYWHRFEFNNTCARYAEVKYRWRSPIGPGMPNPEWTRVFNHKIRMCGSTTIMIPKGNDYEFLGIELDPRSRVGGCTVGQKKAAEERQKKSEMRRAQIQKRLPEATKRAEQADAQNAANAEKIRKDIADNKQRIAKEKDRRYPQSSQENNPAQLPSAQPRVENNFDPSMCDWITTYGNSRVIKACFIKSRPARTNKCDSSAYVCEEQEQQVKHGGTSYVFCGPKGSHCPQ
jgi:hypothetical protein